MDNNRITYAQRSAEKLREGEYPPSYFSVEVVNERNVYDPTVVKLDEPMKIMVSEPERQWIDNIQRVYAIKQLNKMNRI